MPDPTLGNPPHWFWSGCCRTLRCISIACTSYHSPALPLLAPLRLAVRPPEPLLALQPLHRPASSLQELVRPLVQPQLLVPVTHVVPIIPCRNLVVPAL